FSGQVDASDERAVILECNGSALGVERELCSPVHDIIVQGSDQTGVAIGCTIAGKDLHHGGVVLALTADHATRSELTFPTSGGNDSRTIERDRSAARACRDGHVTIQRSRFDSDAHAGDACATARRNGDIAIRDVVGQDARIAFDAASVAERDVDIAVSAALGRQATSPAAAYPGEPAAAAIDIALACHARSGDTYNISLDRTATKSADIHVAVA